MQQRCLVLVELFWQYGVVQACARADGSKNSNVALLSRPNDLRIFIEPFAHSGHGRRTGYNEYASCAAGRVSTAAGYRRTMHCPSRQHR